jgi:hypothetical protein
VPAVSPPVRNEPVTLRLASGREVGTRVISSSRGAVALDLPPVLPAGTELWLMWSAPPAARQADAVVVAHPKHLAVTLAAPTGAERRTSRRKSPARPLAVTAEPVSRAGVPRHPIKGALRDISTGGLSFLTVGPVARGDRLTMSVGLPLEAPLATQVTARVVGVDVMTDRRRLVRCAFDHVPGHLVDAVLAT